MLPVIDFMPDIIHVNDWQAALIPTYLKVAGYPEEYQKIFLDRAYELYKPFVADYNKLIADLRVNELISQYLCCMKGNLPDRELTQFEKDARSEFRPL